jgi:predicted RNA-binding protein with PIN domain
VAWIVDGMNVIGSRPDGWWRDRPAARRRLVAELAPFASQHGPVTVVFDGRAQPGEADDGEADDGDDGRGADREVDDDIDGEDPRVTVLFAPGGPNAADHVIADLARSSCRPVTVVTSDAALAAEVGAAGVPVIGVSAFRRQLR